jgi:TPP-dependent indolepyruvate ferredoxin oxidoreductase alpha subunit
MSLSVARPRVLSTSRPATDEGCAGCPQLALLRALRRSGLETQGGIGCDPGAEDRFAAAGGRWCAVTGASRLLVDGAPALLDEVARAGARLLVIADRVGPVRSIALEASLARAGASVARLDLRDAAATEKRVREAVEAPGTVLVSLSPCVRGLPRAAPLAVEASLCNRCGACLSLACPAISDGGDESVAVDPAVCTGCGLCATLCRSRALRPQRAPLER